ncbi:MAG: prolyl aminopeptidase [Alphaproteobacteria bacterium HGW-Alphaproteobacteria-2]|nr:MAG: prolyl aminopeptidase [Alphaproteobacteria bacterium HGW-Alphaproteobacteria-2]
MDRSASKMRAHRMLHPLVEPFDQRIVDVGDGHRLYVEQCGNPKGPAVVVLHGGPGGGCSPAMRRYFAPGHWRVVLFDQRGCGRSRPHASVEANTSQHLVADVETIRQTLGISDWVVFGGSWGATLALLYAQAHPARVRHLVLRGVFLMTQAELDWFYRGGAALFWPEEWKRFLAPLPSAERADPIAGYHRRLFGADAAESARCAQAWVRWENALAALEGSGGGESPPDYARAFARIENHYFHHGGFLARDGQILHDLPRIAHVPATIVQGRYDMICPPAAAARLAAGLPRADLRMVAAAGHALSEPGISAELVRVMDALGAVAAT